MVLQYIEDIFLHPVLWWLLSICIVVFNVFKTRFSPPVKGYDRLVVSMLLISGALFGGDIYITLQDPVITDFYEIISAENILQGEKGSIGAVLGALIAVSVYLYIRKIPLLESADRIIPFIALAYAAGRVGCFFNGDDFGTVSNLPWAVSFGPFTEAYHAHLSRGWIGSGDVESLRVHPSQLYHATAGLMGFFLLKNWPVNWPVNWMGLLWNDTIWH